MTVTQESVRLDQRVIPERVSCRAYLTANQENVAGNTWNKVNLDAITHDLGTNFNTALYKFTIPISGLYVIYGCVHFLAASVILDKVYAASIYKNNVGIADNAVHASLAGTLGVNIYTEEYLKKDDYIELFVYPEVGQGTDTVDILGGSRYTYLTCRLIKKEGIRQ